MRGWGHGELSQSIEPWPYPRYRSRPSAPTIVMRPPRPARLPRADPPSDVSPDTRADLRISTQETAPQTWMTTGG
jgi:hypothetical protein